MSTEIVLCEYFENYRAKKNSGLQVCNSYFLKNVSMTSCMKRRSENMTVRILNAIFTHIGTLKCWPKLTPIMLKDLTFRFRSSDNN